MRRLRRLLVILGLMVCGPAGASAAADMPACRDLAVMARELDAVVEMLDRSGKINEGSALDRNMGELIEGLAVLAEAMDDEDLGLQVEIMRQTWDDMDWKRFKPAIEAAARGFERIYRLHCSY